MSSALKSEPYFSRETIKNLTWQSIKRKLFIIGRNWSTPELFIMQNLITDNANGDVPLTAKNV